MCSYSTILELLHLKPPYDVFMLQETRMNIKVIFI